MQLTKWLNLMIKFCMNIIVLALAVGVQAQDSSQLTLPQAYELARQHYPGDQAKRPGPANRQSYY